MAAEKADTKQEGAAETAAPEAEESKTKQEQTEEALEPEVEQSAHETSEGKADAEGDDSKESEPDGEAESAEDVEGTDKDEDGPNIFEAITAEVAELRDKYARLQAEWDNFRKRTAAERKSERERAAESLVTDLLPVLDDLERAINHAKESGDGGSLTEGVEAIQNKFLQILGKHKVEQLKAQGEPFDAMQHQAVGTEEDESVPEETVVKVFQQGYKMGDRVIRPAMVVTSTGGPQQAAEEAE